MTETRHLVLAIDPGATGAITYAILGSQPKIVDLGTTRTEVVKTILNVIGSSRPFSRCDVFLEKSFLKPGSSVIAAETYMRHYGNIEASLLAASVPEADIHEINPQDWQKTFAGLVPPRAKKNEERIPPEERRKQIKENSRRIATENFRNLAKMFSRVRDDGRADSALIYLYGLKRIAGEFQPSQSELDRKKSHGKHKAKQKSKPSRDSTRTRTAPDFSKPAGGYPAF